ncbi:MAG TPA: hypothetical protein VGC16_04570 [Rhizomicrobium sp.]
MAFVGFVLQKRQGIALSVEWMTSATKPTATAHGGSLPRLISDDNSIGHVWRSSHVFLRNFALYAGREGLNAAILVVCGAMLEGLSLVLIVPLLGVVTASSAIGGRLQAATEALFQLTGATTRFEKLAQLLALFGIMMLVRAIVLSKRDITLAKLQIGFVEAQRARVIQRLSGARWEQVVQLRHARITHLMSGDIQRIGIAAHFFLQCAMATVMLLAQCLWHFCCPPAWRPSHSRCC